MTDTEHVSAKRMFEHMKESIDTGLKNFVGDTNEDASRERIKEVVEGILDTALEKEREQIVVEVKTSDEGMFVAVVRGPKHVFRHPFFGGLLVVPTSIPDGRYFTVRGVRTRLGIGSDAQSESDVTMTVVERKGLGPETLSLRVTDGGVTGHESFLISETTVRDCSKHGWCACAGMSGKWDRLFIPSQAMRQVFDAFGLLGRMGLR